MGLFKQYTYIKSPVLACKIPKYAIIIALITALLFSGYVIEWILKQNSERRIQRDATEKADAFLLLKDDDIENVVLHHAVYGSWALHREDNKTILSLVQATVESILTVDVVQTHNHMSEAIAGSRGPIFSFFTKTGEEINIGVWYDSLEIENNFYLADRATCDKIELFYAKIINEKTDSIETQKEILTAVSHSNLPKINLRVPDEEIYFPTTQENEKILKYLSLSISTNKLVKEQHISNNTSYYLVDLPCAEKKGNEISINLEFPDGKNIIAEIGDGVIFLNETPYFVNAEINAALEQICHEIYNSGIP